MRELTGRVAVVTGAASGIGYGLSERFAAEGMKVVLADIEESALAKAERSLREAGATTVAVRCDVSDADSVEALAERSLDAFGAVHVLCNNAGVSARGAVWETSLPDWEWVLGVNLWGVIHGIRTFVPILLDQDEGHVVNTASMAGLVFGTLGSYSVSKHGVVALSEALQISLAMREARVGVSVLCPGWVNTRILEADRNRPAAARATGEPPEPPQMALARELVEQLVANGMPPAEVAASVVEAIREQRFYVITHPDMLPAVEARARAIVEGLPPGGTQLF